MARAILSFLRICAMDAEFSATTPVGDNLWIWLSETLMRCGLSGLLCPLLCSPFAWYLSLFFLFSFFQFLFCTPSPLSMSTCCWRSVSLMNVMPYRYCSCFCLTALPPVCSDLVTTQFCSINIWSVSRHPVLLLQCTAGLFEPFSRLPEAVIC